MDETVYQCPECNFNTDHIKKLDDHIIEKHGNDNDDEDNYQMHDNDDNDVEDDVTSKTTITTTTTTTTDNETNKNYTTINQHQYYNNNYTNSDDDDNDDDLNSEINDSLNYDDNQTNEEEEEEDDDDDVKQDIEKQQQQQQFQLQQLYQQSLQLKKQQQHQQQQRKYTTPKRNTNTNNDSYLNNNTITTPQFNSSNTGTPVPNTDNHYERQYTCKLCTFCTNNPRAILYHRKHTHGEKLTIYECAYCQYASQYSGKVERHTLLRHKIDIGSSSKKTSTSNTQQQQQQQEQMNLSIQSSLSNEHIPTIKSQSKSSLPSTPKETTSNKHQQQQLNDLNSSTIAFQCTKCPCKYKRSNDLYKHMRAKHAGESENIEPLQTSQTFSMEQNESFNNHSIKYEQQQQQQHEQYDEKKNHINDGSYECPYCTFTSFNDNDYLNHVKDHLCGKSFRCTLCNAIYKYRGDCVVHLKRKHQKADLIAQNYVQRFNIDEMNLNEINPCLKPKLYEEVDDEEKLFGCCYCDYKANYKGDVYKHQTRRHPGTPKNVRIFEPHQNQSLTKNQNDSSSINLLSQSQIQLNEDVNDDDDNNNNDDDESQDLSSNNSFNNNNNNQNSVTSQIDLSNQLAFHNSSSINLTPTINNSSKNLSYTSQHVFVCNLCPYRAKSQAKLQFHLATHDNLKPYMCPICKRRANFKWDIQKHLRKVHANTDLEVVCLSPNEARQTIGNYMAFHGNNHAKNKTFNLNSNNNNNNNNNNNTPTTFNHQTQTSHLNNKQSQLIESLSIKLYKCSQCLFDSNDEHTISDHLRTEHNYYGKVRIFKSEDALESSTISSSPFIILNKQAKIENTSNTNININNNNQLLLAKERKFKCSLCNRTSKWQWDIRKHLRTVHKDASGGDVITLSDSEIASSMASPLHETDQMQTNINTSLNATITTLTKPTPKINYNSIGSDATGNKKFKCTICPYRTNWKADLYRHIRKRHGISNPSIEDVIILTPEEAASSINEYETLHGIYIRKRSRVEYEQQAPPNKKQKITPSSLTQLQQQVQQLAKLPIQYANDDSQNDDEEYNDVGDENDDEIDDENEDEMIIDENQEEGEDGEQQQQQSDENTDDLIKHGYSSNGSIKPSTKPFMCTKCNYRSNRKSDVLRHLKVRHALHNQKYLRILSPDEAARTIDDYENNKFQQKLANNGLNNQIMELKTEDNQFKCPYCTFKHANRLMLRRHLISHQNKSSGFKCNVCSFSSEWRYTVKKHIIASHWHIPHASVVRCSAKSTLFNKCKVNSYINKLNSIDDQQQEHQQQETKSFNDNNDSFNDYEECDEKDEELNNLSQEGEVGIDKEPREPSLMTPNGKSYISAFIPVTDSEGNSSGKKKMYFCETCPYKTNNYCNLKQHLLQHRPEAGQSKCRYCPYYVSMSRLLKQHEILHNEVNEQQHQEQLKRLQATTLSTTNGTSHSNTGIYNHNFESTTTTFTASSSCGGGDQDDDDDDDNNNEDDENDVQMIENENEESDDVNSATSSKQSVRSTTSTNNNQKSRVKPSNIQTNNNQTQLAQIINQVYKQQQLLDKNTSNSFNPLDCMFCDHVSANLYKANQHLMYHLDNKVNLPKDFFLEKQIRQILNMHKSTANTKKSIVNGDHHKYNKKLNGHKTEPEYIDIAEYEKFYSVLQEAGDQ